MASYECTIRRTVGSFTIALCENNVMTPKGETASPAAVDAAVAKSLLAKLPAEARQAILDTGVQVRLAAKDYFAHPGDPPRLGLVIKGMTRVGRLTQDGREITVFWDRPGEVLGLGAAIRWPSPSLIQAVTDTTILEFPAAMVVDLARTDARVGWAVTEHIAMLMRRAVDEVVMYAHGDLRTRIERRLLEAAFKPQAPGTLLVAEVTQDDLAQAVGAARQSVARVIKDLRDEGSIRPMYGGVLIVRPEALASARSDAA
jgi:CRP/FNR family transcriptional regulator